LDGSKNQVSDSIRREPTDSRRARGDWLVLQISAAIQPTTVQPNIKFTAKIAADHLPARIRATMVGRKYEPRLITLTNPRSAASTVRLPFRIFAVL
jgi:hypothetical protein